MPPSLKEINKEVQLLQNKLLQETNQLLDQLDQIQNVLFSHGGPVLSRKRKRTPIQSLEQQGYQIHYEYHEYLSKLKEFSEQQKAVLMSIREGLMGLIHLEFNKGQDAHKILMVSSQLLNTIQMFDKQHPVLPSLDACKRIVAQEINRWFQTASFPDLEKEAVKALTTTSLSLAIMDTANAIFQYPIWTSLGVTSGALAIGVNAAYQVSDYTHQEKNNLLSGLGAFEWCLFDMEHILNFLHDTTTKTLKQFKMCVESISLTMKYQDDVLKSAVVDAEHQLNATDEFYAVYDRISDRADRYAKAIKLS
ncbi:uncharacterized protein B0P05DRAFT_547140 [Gilbertella persicaria]|uniref:uncharacterized protein n=1 Tax=Gilbertella persicaria TaxID=101096 RepID=UPI00221FF8D4|nr:uncharacterized protein B0P05DRAFT_547140 [Gilbertella persicaria]KAI8075344.1 hypothetical protein B0P05DRAFT_547140 [Gilbertella persicaria]